MADNDPFSTIKTYHVESRFYKVNGKGKSNGTDVPITIPVRHPLAGFTRPLTSLEYGMVDTYHLFELPKKGVAREANHFSYFGRYG